MASNSEEVQIANGQREEVIVRNVANFGPDIWGDLFTSFILDNEIMETYNTEVEVLKERVRAMLVSAAVDGDSTPSTVANLMSLIDTIERLGLSYHFENDIEQQLQRLFNDYVFVNYYDLFTVSLHFRIFRQHGHKMSPNVFSKFTDENDKFIESLSSDVLGMLSLYEAAHLRIYGDDVLEEAFNFTTMNLKKLSNGKFIENSLVAEQVEHAIVQPLHRGLPRMEARYYISVYRQLESKNDMLLKFAQLDYNRLQMLYAREICDVTRWWKNVLLAAEVTHVRDRPVEAYFWCAAIFDAPEFSLARILLTKFFLFMTIIDDTYDAYGTYEELQPFTEAWLRWDAEAVDLLPNYMKPYAIEELKRMVKCYHVETKWLKDGYVPVFDEFMANELSNCMDPLHTITFLGAEYATIETFEWVASKPKIVYASSVIIRLLDDIGGHVLEHERIHIPTAPDCYMKEYNVSKEVALEEMYKLIEGHWKDVNEEMLRPTAAPMHLLMPILNLLRNANISYKFETDGFTKPEKVKHLIRALYVEPVPI